MDPVLQSLILYQELCTELDRLNARLKQFPDRMKRIEQDFEAASGSLKSAQNVLEENQKERRQHESELQDLENKLAKYNEQLMQVKTNDEYKAMRKEIEGVKGTIGSAEERILILMEQIDGETKRTREEETALAEKKKEDDALKAESNRERSEVEQEAARLEGERATAQKAIGADVLALFKKIAGSRNGVALARAREERCMECKVRVRPQVFQEIKKNEQIIQCDSCSRILYFIVEAPADTTAP